MDFSNLFPEVGRATEKVTLSEIEGIPTCEVLESEKAGIYEIPETAPLLLGCIQRTKAKGLSNTDLTIHWLDGRIVSLRSIRVY